MLDRSKSKTIGSTDISAIFNCNPYKSAFSLYQRLIGDEIPVTDTAAMKRGRTWETILSSIYHVEHEFDERYLSCGNISLTHNDIEYLTGSPDVLFCDNDRKIKEKTTGIISVPCSHGLEIKTADISQKNNYDFSSSEPLIPMHYYMQCQWLCGLANVDRWDFIVGFFKGDKMVSHESCSFDFDEEIYDKMVKAAVEFWENHVIPRNPPEDATPAELETFYRRKYPQHVSGKMADRTDRSDEVIQILSDIKVSIKHLEYDEQQYKSELIGLIGDCEAIESYFGKVTFKKNKDSVKTNWKSMVDEMSTKIDQEYYLNLMDKYSTIVTGPRVLRLPKNIILNRNREQ